jgi:hypothetical protein
LQKEHFSDPVLEVTVPATHRLHVVEPKLRQLSTGDGAKLPIGHFWQVLCATAGLNVPPVQGLQNGSLFELSTL